MPCLRSCSARGSPMSEEQTLIDSSLWRTKPVSSRRLHISVGKANHTTGTCRAGCGGAGELREEQHRGAWCHSTTSCPLFSVSGRAPCEQSPKVREGKMPLRGDSACKRREGGHRRGQRRGERQYEDWRAGGQPGPGSETTAPTSDLLGEMSGPRSIPRRGRRCSDR